MTKRRLSDEDARFEEDKTRIEVALALRARAMAYPPVPTFQITNEKDVLDLQKQQLLEYAAERAEALGVPVGPCKRCKTKPCRMDITTHIGRSLKCSTCHRAKQRCSATQEGEELRSKYLARILQGTLDGEPGLEWRLRCEAFERRKNAAKRMREEGDEKRTSAAQGEVINLQSCWTLLTYL